MNVGVGLPTTRPSADGTLITHPARRAETGPFSCLGRLSHLAAR